MSQMELSEVNELWAKASLLYDQPKIEAAIDKIAGQMNEQLADKTPVMLCVMNGAVIFMGQLVTKLKFPLQIDYVHATRYLGETEGREIHWVAEPNIDLNGRTVVIIEDILDGGLTLAAVKQHCFEKGAAEIYTAAMVDKQRPREPGGLETCDFVGLTVENKFLIGYGLDYKGFFRNVPGIYVVTL